MRDGRQDRLKGFNGRLCSLASLLESVGKILHASKTLEWIFGKRLQNHCLKSRRDCWFMLMQRLRRIEHLLNGYFLVRAIERTCAAEPLVRDNTQGVLVACRRGLPRVCSGAIYAIVPATSRGLSCDEL